MRRPCGPVSRGSAASRCAHDRAMAVWRRTGGNPFFVGEVARRADGDRLPDSVRAVLQGRLAVLDPDSCACSRWRRCSAGSSTTPGSPGGRQPPSLLCSTISTGRQRSGLVEPAGMGRHRFVHELVRETLLDGIRSLGPRRPPPPGRRGRRAADRPRPRGAPRRDRAPLRGGGRPGRRHLDGPWTPSSERQAGPGGSWPTTKPPPTWTGRVPSPPSTPRSRRNAGVISCSRPAMRGRGSTGTTGRRSPRTGHGRGPPPPRSPPDGRGGDRALRATPAGTAGRLHPASSTRRWPSCHRRTRPSELGSSRGAPKPCRSSSPTRGGTGPRRPGGWPTATDDPLAIVPAAVSLGLLSLTVGHLDEAVKVADAGVDAARRLGDLEQLSSVLMLRSLVAARPGRARRP